MKFCQHRAAFLGFFFPYWNFIFLSALRLAAISQQLQQDSVQELTNQFLWSTNTLFSSAGFTLDCCHGSTNLPMSIRQGQSVWQRYCLERWFTLHSLNSQEVCVCDFVCVPDCLLFEFFFFFLFVHRLERNKHMKVQHNVFLSKQKLQ